MDCFVPGQILISPKFDPEQAKSHLSDALPMPFEVLYSVEDVLKHYGFGSLITGFRQKFEHLPMVIRVPEGREEEASSKLRGQTYVASACPDYLVRPSGPIRLNRGAIDEAIHFIGAEAVGPMCGSACRIAVLDSGIDPGVVTPGALRLQQYDSQAPAPLGTPPEDRLGHGSLVAAIIHRIAPGAEILSVKVMNDAGTVGCLVAGLYLAEASGPCHLIYLSLSVSCDGEPCTVCGTNVSAGVNAEQLQYFFQQFTRGSALGSVLIAAAGNNYSHVAMPAIFPEVLAVGAFDPDTH